MGKIGFRKVIIKSLCISTINMPLIFMLNWIFDNMGSLISGIYFENNSVNAWIRGLNQGHMTQYLIVTCVLSGFLFLIYEITVNYIDNSLKLVMPIVIGMIAILFLITGYWKYIQQYCYGLEGATIEDAFFISYGDNTSSSSFWTIYSEIMYCVGIFANRFDIYIRKKDMKIIWRQILRHEDFFSRMLYLAVPYGIFISGEYFIVCILGILVKPLFIIWVFTTLAIFFLKKINQFSDFQKYYLTAKKNLAEDNIVIVQESQYIQESFFIHYLYKKKTLERMGNKGIWFLPYEMALIPDIFIKLDFYDEWMSLRNSCEKTQILNIMSELRGTFNLAFFSDSITNNAIDYDGKYSRFTDLLDEIERLTKYLKYRKTIKGELDKIFVLEAKRSNCIYKEILYFKSRMAVLTEEFLGFDYAIKWLEIANYLFALVDISKCDIVISKEMQRNIEYADFSKWRRISKEMNNLENDPYMVVMADEDERSVFLEFEKIWGIVTTRTYNFENYTVNELLEGANKLRDYTRGHGVFTFDISQEINIGLTKIIVFLLNQLINYMRPVGNMENLEENRWIIYLNSIPYFLYSIDKKFKEYKYESFQMGSSIAISMD